MMPPSIVPTADGSRPLLNGTIPTGWTTRPQRSGGEELKNAEREVVFTPATESDRVWEKIHVLSLCLDEESTLGPRADHFSLLALAAIKADLLRLGIGRVA